MAKKSITSNNVVELKKQLTQLRLDKQLGRLKNTRQIFHLRKQIARLFSSSK